MGVFFFTPFPDIKLEDYYNFFLFFHFLIVQLRQPLDVTVFEKKAERGAEVTALKGEESKFFFPFPPLPLTFIE